MVIKINYTSSDIYVSTNVSPVYVVVNYSGTSGGGGNFVPYTGATGDVDLGEYELKAGQVEFDQTPTGAIGAAVMRWNDSDGTVDLGLKGGNVTLQVGQEQVLRVVNKTGADLLESQYRAVRIRLVSEGGSQGQRLAVVLAQGDNDPDSTTTIGIVTENIDNNQEGFITTSGEVRGINTTGSLQSETWVDGDIIYLSPTIPGGITKVKPTAPQHLLQLGYVIYAHAVNGKIFVKIDNGYELSELHDVYAPSPTDGQGIFWNTANLRYQNNTVAGILGYTPVPTTRTLTINGTAYDLSADRSWTVSGTNIYTADGTLTGDRTVTSGGFPLTFTGSNTAATAIARGLNLTHTLIAAANNDVLVGLDVNPTFTNGTFTGVKNIGLRVIADASINSLTVGKGANNLFSNTALGENVFRSVTTGNFNTAVGRSNSYSITIGQYNTAFGSVALFSNISSDGNTAIGQQSLTSTTGQYNTGLGNRSGANITTGQYNTVIGAFGFTSLGLTTGSYNTIIGSQLTGLPSNLSNNIILADGQGNIRIRAWDTGNVTINSTTDPGEKLYVNGTARVSSGLISNEVIGVVTPAGTTSYGIFSQSSRSAFYIGSMQGTNATDSHLVLGADSTGTPFVFKGGVGATLTGGTEYFRITTSGISVNNTNPFIDTNFKGLNIAGGTAGSQIQLCKSDGTRIATINANSSNSSCDIFTLSTGNLLLGTNSRGNLTVFATSGNIVIQDGGTFTDVASSILSVNSSTKGFLPPRLSTTQKNAIGTPAAGLQVYDTTLNSISVYDGATWRNDTDTVTTNRQAASYTLALTDRGKLVEMNVAGANNLTVPLNSSIAFPIGTKIDLSQYGAGQTTVVATGGVTVRSAGGALKLAVQYSGASLVKIGTDEWYLFGDITV